MGGRADYDCKSGGSLASDARGSKLTVHTDSARAMLSLLTKLIPRPGGGSTPKSHAHAHAPSEADIRSRAASSAVSVASLAPDTRLRIRKQSRFARGESFRRRGDGSLRLRQEYDCVDARTPAELDLRGGRLVPPAVQRREDA